MEVTGKIYKLGDRVKCDSGGCSNFSDCHGKTGIVIEITYAPHTFDPGRYYQRIKVSTERHNWIESNSTYWDKVG